MCAKLHRSELTDIHMKEGWHTQQRCEAPNECKTKGISTSSFLVHLISLVPDSLYHSKVPKISCIEFQSCGTSDCGL